MENKAYSLERFNFLFGFGGFFREERRSRRNLAQIVHKDIQFLIVVNDSIDNSSPLLESLSGTNEEVVFVKYLE